MIDARLHEVLACPSCAHGLEPAAAALRCGGCGRDYPVLGGIPDLRLGYDDPYTTLAADLEAAAALLERSADLDFAGLLREHWRMAGKRPELAERFLAGDLVSLRRS